MGAVSTTHLTKEEVRDLLGVNAIGLWWLTRQHEGFPAPDPHHNPGPFAKQPAEPVWDATAVYRWAAKTPDYQHRGATLLRPLPDDFEPGCWQGTATTSRGPAIDWHTTLGTVRIVHTTKDRAASAVATELARTGAGEIVTVCALYGDLGHTGPALVAADTAHPSIEYEAAWGHVAALAGQPLPWWPSLLRLPQLITKWRPGTSAITVEVPADDREKTLRRAAQNKSFDGLAKAALTDMANEIRNRRVDNVALENDIFGRETASDARPIIIAARHDTSAHPLPCIDDPKALADGWKTIATSTHPDAVAAVEIALSHSPELLPYGTHTDIPTHQGAVAEQWTRRLTPCDPTAAHASLVADKTVDAFFTDPLTDMPVVRTQDAERPRWHFYSPLSLPTGGELASVILHDTVWIKTTEGLIHPGPCDPHNHLWWGDGWGDRPTEAAHVINLLLDDIGADIDLNEHYKQAPKGLTALLNQDHPRGTELSRATLLHARMTPPKSRG